MKATRLSLAVGFAIISVIWGSTWLVIKIGLESIPPFYGVALRFTVATAVLWAVVRARKEKLLLTREAISLYLSLALLSFSIPFALVYWSEQYIPSGLASILFAAYPFVVAVGSHLFLPSERLTGYKVAGIGLGFLGVLVIFWSDLSLGAASAAGMGGILVSTILQGSSLVIVKRLHRNISPTVMTLGGMIFGTVVMYLIAFALEDLSSLRFDARGIASIVYLGTFGSVVTFVIYYWLLHHVEAVYLSLVSFVTPVLAVILGAVVLDESFSSRVIVGSGLILLGILISNGREVAETVNKAMRLQGPSS